MKKESLNLFICLLCIVSLTGCATTFSPLKTHFENNFTGFIAPEKNTIKETPLKGTYQDPYDKVWNSILTILCQNTMIVSASKESGIIGYVDVDGIMINKKFYYWEFPFVILTEQDVQGTQVYVYPMVSLFESDEKFSKQKWWETVKTGFDQKGQEFLDKLSTQLVSTSRYPWLTK